MSVPTFRHTKSKRNKRRMHIFLEKPSLTACKKCGRQILPHTVCGHCGFYNGKEVVNVLEKLEKKEKKKLEKEIKTKEQEEQKQKPLSWKELSRK